MEDPPCIFCFLVDPVSVRFPIHFKNLDQLPIDDLPYELAEL